MTHHIAHPDRPAPSQRPGRTAGPARTARHGGPALPDGLAHASLRGRSGIRLLLAAGLGSMATALLTAIWRVRPGWNGFAETGASLLRNWLSAQDVALTGLMLALFGILSAGLAAAALHRSGTWPRWLVPAGVIQAGVLGLGLLGMGIIAILGYLMALAMPLALVLLAVQLVRKGDRARWITLAITAGVLAAGLGSGLLTGPAMTAFAGILPQVPGAVMDAGPSLLLMATGLLWLAVALHAARSRGVGGRTAAFVLRHRRVITVLAAMGPLPYALLRLSWLTPWPLLAPDALDASDQFWGFALSVGAWAGFVLTLGLIRPWGETFPRWMPAVAGRPVPVAFAAVPGGVVAAAICAGAVPMLQAFAQGSAAGLVMALVMPFWFWGPMLGLAVWAYVLHRRHSPRPSRGSAQRSRPATLDQA